MDAGQRDKRGDWAPTHPAQTAPLFVFPPRPRALLTWLPQYFLPYNLLFFASAWVWWVWVVPPAEVLQTLSAGWILRLWLVNTLAAALWFGAFELQLYIRRAQGNRFKYNRHFPADRPSGIFWWRLQTRDNAMRTLAIGVPIWTALQVLMLWSYGAGVGNWLTWAQNPVWLAVLCLIVPVIHEFHFYCIHRLIHTGLLYRYVHAVHHRSNNPSPWSSLSMHPVEHLLYFGSVVYHLVIPSHPLIALYQLHVAGFGAVPGHVGFDRIELTDAHSIDSHAYIHYLHHKYFEVNYGDGLIPIDRWFGTFHDGSDASLAQMRSRLRARQKNMR